MDINNVKCSNQNQACSNALNQVPRTGYKSITNTNVSKNFILDYLAPKMINNPRMYYWITSDRVANSFSTYENMIRVRVLHCDGNSGYVFNGQFGRNAGIGTFTQPDQMRTTKIGMSARVLNPCG